MHHRLQPDGTYRTMFDNQIVNFHPSSVLAQRHPKPETVVYNEIVLTNRQVPSLVMCVIVGTHSYSIHGLPGFRCFILPITVYARCDRGRISVACGSRAQTVRVADERSWRGGSHRGPCRICFGKRFIVAPHPLTCAD